MAHIFQTLLSEPSGFGPSRCTKIFLNSNCSSSYEEIYIIKAISKSHFLGTDKKNRQSRTTCSYFCSREIKNRNGLACNPDKTEEDHLCSCFQSITLPGID